ncbi:nuclear transport factor 2 family protein [Arenimonas sp. GDDSR-1]|uniref:nuclear transport factor 2 family protein n=1 Tax=Arenimonas sp. GDDSR-1 TaxID=2950125 RepID=UPI00260D6A1B|nr:nuclear transport factor 2 family protein [Arenimonas sp. GDDSR-1]
MKHRITLVFLAFFATLFLFSLSTAAKAQVAENSPLFKTVMELDRQLFDEGFNQCKLARFETLAAPDLEFFHDKDGRQNRAEFLKASRQNICGNPNSRPVRTLLPGSTQVFPLENNGVLYGAIQQGVHRFHTQGQDPAKYGYTDAKFSHVWILNKGVWQLKTALSFDHQSVKPGQAAAKPAPKAQTLFGLTLASYRLQLDYAGVE